MADEAKQLIVPSGGPDRVQRIGITEVWRDRFYSWLLSQNQREVKKKNRLGSILVLVVMVGPIGWLDYITGARISLTLFYTLPIVFAVARLGWRAGCAISLISVIVRTLGDLVAGGYIVSLETMFWNRAVDLSTYMLLVTVLHALLMSQSTLEERVRQRTIALEQAIAARNRMQAQLFDVSRRERSSIGHDLHDGLGQHLTATSFAADMLARDLAQEGHPAQDKARNITKMLQDGIAKTRQIARGLLLATIEPETLGAEIGELVTRLSSETGVACRLEQQGRFEDVDVATASHLFYIAQEAARNALRHARPSTLVVSLRASDCDVVLEVLDDGCGLPSAETSQGGVGLSIMAHRAEIIGGEFKVTSTGGKGTTVYCRVPKLRSAQS